MKERTIKLMIETETINIMIGTIKIIIGITNMIEGIKHEIIKEVEIITEEIIMFRKEEELGIILRKILIYLSQPNYSKKI